MAFDDGQPGHVTEHNRLAEVFVLADRYASLQAAVDALPAGGGAVYLAPGTHTGGVVTNKPNVQIVGAGGAGQSSTVGDGATIIEVPNGEWGLTYALAAASHNYRGPTLRNVHFKPASGATPLGGIFFDNCSNSRLHDVTVSGMATGIRLGTAGSTGGSQYHEFHGVNAILCTTGIDVHDSNGLRLFGGFIEYYPGGAAATTPGTIGIKVRSAGEAAARADTFLAFGTIIQFQAIGVELAADAAELHGCRFEACDVGVDILATARDAKVFGGAFSNSIIGSTGIGIRIANSPAKIGIHGPTITAVASAITDNRTVSPPTAQLHEGGSVQTLGRLMLKSPNGTWWTVAVSDAGAITAS